MHGVFGPIVVDREVEFVSGRKWILPVFVYCGFGKLEGGRLVFSWVGGVVGGDMVLEVLAPRRGEGQVMLNGLRSSTVRGVLFGRVKGLELLRAACELIHSCSMRQKWV